jgi:hypothetical protein
MQVKISALFAATLAIASSTSGFFVLSRDANDTQDMMMSLLVSPAGDFLQQLPLDHPLTAKDTNAVPPVTNIPTVAKPISPSSASPKLVFAHHIVGNTYNYTVDTWRTGELLRSTQSVTLLNVVHCRH